MEVFVSSTSDSNEARIELRLALAKEVGAIIRSFNIGCPGECDSWGPAEYIYEAFFIVRDDDESVRLLHYCREDHFSDSEFDRTWDLSKEVYVSTVEEAHSKWAEFTRQGVFNVGRRIELGMDCQWREEGSS